MVKNNTVNSPSCIDIEKPHELIRESIVTYHRRFTISQTENEKFGLKQTIQLRNYISNKEYVYWNLITNSTLVPRTRLRKSVLAVNAGLRRFSGAV